MANIDGSYWRVKWKMGNSTGYLLDDEKRAKYDTLLDARVAATEHENEHDWDVKCKAVRCRPKFSITKATELLMEARAAGVELWMRVVDDSVWLKINKNGIPCYTAWSAMDVAVGLSGQVIVSKRKVATPADAKRSDAKRREAKAQCLPA